MDKNYINGDNYNGCFNAHVNLHQNQNQTLVQYKNFLNKNRIGQINIYPQLPYWSFLLHRAAVWLP